MRLNLHRWGIALLLLALLLPTKAFGFDHSYQAYHKVLKTVVNSDGLVNFRALKANPLELNRAVYQLEKVSNAEYASWDQREQIAFWVNSYNIYTLKLIIANYPVASIRDIGLPLIGPWMKDFFTLLGEKRSLKEIENSILRKQFRDPRIHFALNCASMSCPELRKEPYVATRLSEQFDDAARNFLQDERKNLFDRENGRVYFSKIFKWYKKDFEQKETLIKYISRFLRPIDRDYLRMKKMKVHYLKYDWSLNEAKK